MNTSKKFRWTFYPPLIAICFAVTLPTFANTILTTVDENETVGEYTSLVLNQSGYPVISYYDSTHGDLKLAVCQDVTCASSPILRTLDSMGDVGQYTSLALDSNDHPLISYYDLTHGDLKLVVCDDALCSSYTSNSLDENGNVGMFTSIVIRNGSPVISYYDQDNKNLKLIKCTDATCSPPINPQIPVGTKPPGSDVGQYSSLVFDNNGFLSVSYYYYNGLDGGHYATGKCITIGCNILKYNILDNTVSYLSLAFNHNGHAIVTYHVNYPDLSSALALASYQQSGSSYSLSYRTLDKGEDIGRFSSLRLNHDDHPVVSYYDGTQGDLKVAVDGNELSQEVVDSQGDVGSFTSLVINSKNNPVISYHGNGHLKLAVCDNPTCSPPEMDVQGNGRSIPNGDSSPSSEDGTDFGQVTLTDSYRSTFTVRNLKKGILNLTDLTLSGTGCSAFTVTQTVSSSVLTSFGSASFQVSFSPTNEGTFICTINLVNDDSDENPYQFDLRGERGKKSPPEVSLPMVTPSNEFNITSPVLNSESILNVSVEGPGENKVISNNIECKNGELCQVTYSTGTKVTLTPIAAPGSYFSSWGGHDDCTDGQVWMIESRLCKAFFRLLPKLTVTKFGEGKVSGKGIDCGEDCTEQYDPQTHITLTAFPTSATQLKEWRGDCSGTSPEVEITMDQAKTCTAVFETTQITEWPSVQVPQEETKVSVTQKEEVPTPQIPQSALPKVEEKIKNQEDISISSLVLPVPPTPYTEEIPESTVSLVTPESSNKDELPPLEKEGSSPTEIPSAYERHEEVIDIIFPPEIITSDCLLSSGKITVPCNARGGTISNQLEVQEGASLSNAVLENDLINQGWSSNLTILPPGTLTGGVVSGSVYNQGVMKDFEFVGEQITGGHLSGEILNRSQIGGYFKDVTLEANTHLIGGIITGRVQGDPQAPALLEHVIVQAHSSLSGVTLGMGTTLEEGVIIEPMRCRLWGIQDAPQGSQLFTLDYSDRLDLLAVQTQGPLHKKLDLEALEIHPQTGELYATSGNETSKRGHLYLVNQESGELSDLGALGPKKVAALSFHPDGSLWGYGQLLGLFRLSNPLDLNTLDVILAEKEVFGVEALSWNVAGTRLYLIVEKAKGAELKVYRPGHSIVSVCEEMMNGMEEIEGLETLPDDRLVMSFHNHDQLVFVRLDLANCQLLEEGKILTSYVDIEGLAWEGCQTLP